MTQADRSLSFLRTEVLIIFDKLRVEAAFFTILLIHANSTIKHQITEFQGRFVDEQMKESGLMNSF